MGESYLSGVEFKDSGQKERNLLETLNTLVAKQIRLIMKTDEITVLVDTTITVASVRRHENRIETGHLTIDDVYFEMVNDSATKIYFPLVQYRGVSQFGESLILNFDSYRWMIITEH